MVASGVILYSRLNDGGRSGLVAIRRELSAQGFKTNFSQFDFSPPPDSNPKAQALLAAAELGRDLFPSRELGLMRSVDEQTARVISRQETLSSDLPADVWATARTNFAAVQPVLDKACDALA